jgi:REP element-mobilizing transposase RayT
MATIMHLNVYYHLILIPGLKCPMSTAESRLIINKSIADIINKKRNKAIIVNGTFDHVHILYSPNPRISIAETINAIKTETQANPDITQYIKNFEWQDGYLALSVGLSDVKNLIRYIRNQGEIHEKLSFKDEFIGLLDENDIEYEQDGLPDFNI